MFLEALPAEHDTMPLRGPSLPLSGLTLYAFTIKEEWARPPLVVVPMVPQLQQSAYLAHQ